MPIYIFQNEKTGEIIEVIQKMNEPHVFSKDGIAYKRVFTKANASIDTKINAFSSQDFNEKTRNKKETVGSLWDRSREMSEKRERVEGIDKVKQKYFEDYSKKRRGKKHPDQIKKDNTYTI